MGYQVLEMGDDGAVPELIRKNIVDLVIVDTRIEIDCSALVEFLRLEEETSTLPVVCLARDRLERVKLEQLGDGRIEIIDIPYSIGSVVSKIATQLRLRKMRGAEEETASLAEMNATLRELHARFSAELDEAREIQESLLPESLPDDDRYDIAVVYHPLEQVGGDWYYVREEPSGQITIIVADVTGHGLSAAFIGSMTKLAMTAADKELPHELMTEMNRLMAPQIPGGKFVTMCGYGYHPDTGKIDFCRAGHPPGLLLHRNTGEVEQLVGDGFAIGFFEDAEYQGIETQLEVGDVIVTYSDALQESQNRDNEMYGLDRFGEALKNTPPEATAAQILESVLVDFETFCDGRLVKDDVTVVVLKRRK